ncbi:unnamed protein product [Gulo gulo]|uniref:Uncharacterized protein n=1 Tax=Gulo gulo TaxID=48420 RepID=A0A9X9PYB3_GULGU|nr:unnamed protein product [Gulo gulo]
MPGGRKEALPSQCLPGHQQWSPVWKESTTFPLAPAKVPELAIIV